MMFRSLHLRKRGCSIFRIVVLLFGWLVLFWILIRLSVSFHTWYILLSPPLFVLTPTGFDWGGWVGKTGGGGGGGWVPDEGTGLAPGIVSPHSFSNLSRVSLKLYLFVIDELSHFPPWVLSWPSILVLQLIGAYHLPLPSLCRFSFWMSLITVSPVSCICDISNLAIPPPFPFTHALRSFFVDPDSSSS